MRVKTIKSRDKIITHIYLPDLNYGLVIKDKNQLVSALIKDIKESRIGYAGFKTKQGLQKYLIETVFDKTKNDSDSFNYVLDKEKVTSIIERVIILCSVVLPNNPTNIFVFPTFSNFVRKEMSGTTGYTPWKNTILVFINPLNQQWEKALAETVGHEYCHSVFLKYNKCESLLDSMVFEGLAEHFREQVVDGKRAPWTSVFNYEQSKVLLVKIKSERLLHSTDRKTYRDVFFGTEKHIRWTGYTIGYYIVKLFLKNNPNLKWRDILSMPPKDIFNKSNFLNKNP